MIEGVIVIEFVIFIIRGIIIPDDIGIDVIRYTHSSKKQAGGESFSGISFRLAGVLAHPSDGRGRAFYRDAPNSRIAARFFSLV